MVRAYAQTLSMDSRQSAQQVAMKLIRAESAPAAFGSPVHYAGSYGLIIRGLPGGPTPAQDIILGRHQYVYQMIAPGKTLVADQRAALNSLKFIPMSGLFLSEGGVAKARGATSPTTGCVQKARRRADRAAKKPHMP